MRRVIIIAIFLFLALLPACGRKAPTFPPDGELTVLSEPPGAGVYLNGTLWGEFTPTTITDLEAGPYEVVVELWGYAAAPDTERVTIGQGASESVEFSLTPAADGPPKVALFESLSNVSCVGCPDLAAVLDGLMSPPDYGPDKVLLIKYSTDFPQGQDPFYIANEPANDVRRSFYYPGGQTIQIPILHTDGTLYGGQGVVPTFSDLTTLTDSLLTAHPGIAIGISADVAALTVPVTVTISASRHVDLSDYSLQLALVEDYVEFRDPPGNQGETEFHWVMRDFETAAVTLLSPGEGSPVVIDSHLHSSVDFVTSRLVVIGFLQHNQTREVLQAGSTADTSKQQGEPTNSQRTSHPPATPAAKGHQP